MGEMGGWKALECIGQDCSHQPAWVILSQERLTRAGWFGI